MSNYIPPDPSVAESIRRRNEESRECEERLKALSDEELKTILYDRAQPSGDRFQALNLLFVPLHQQSRDIRHKLFQLLEVLIDDPDLSIARVAIRHCPKDYERCLKKIRELTKSSDIDICAAAMHSLAEGHDDEVMGLLRDWFHGADQNRRCAAIEGLTALDTQEARQELARDYEQGGRDERDKMELAISLLQLSDTRGLTLLESIAKSAKGDLSVHAAMSIYFEHEDDGLRLILHVLDHGDQAAKQGLVRSISEFHELPNAWTAEGFDEARLWVEHELALRHPAN